jgi:hypothetical protein
MTEQTEGVDLPTTMSVADIAEPAVSMDRLAKIYIRMRDKLAELTREYETQEAKIKEQQAEVAAAMKDIIQQAGGESIRTAHGTVTLKTTKRFYAQDWEAMYQFINDNHAPFLLEKRIAQKNMQEFLEANPETVPPGLNTMSELTVAVTKPRK